ncbi:MAG TPA: polysaccharide biosynthesis protein [Myxococcales bacterium]|nr:polysaccharide biosynthesis protein [Myxococcales bacterium]
MHHLTSLLVACCILCMSSCATTASNRYQELGRDVGDLVQGSTLGPGDILSIRVYEDKEMGGDYEIARDGGIDFPYAGRVTVEGLNAPQIAKLIRQKLANGFYRDPHVNVAVKSFNSKKVFVLGEVKKPGRLQYVDNMTVVEAITLAGGFETLAERNYVIVTRREQRIPVPVEKIMQGLASNFLVRPGDLVYVPRGVLAQ